MPPTPLDNWLKKATPDDTGLIRPPAAARVSAHKDEVRSIAHGYFQSQFSLVFIYRETPPVNYLFTVGHIPQNYLIIVPIVLPGTVYGRLISCQFSLYNAGP